MWDSGSGDDGVLFRISKVIVFHESEATDSQHGGGRIVWLLFEVWEVLGGIFSFK